MQEKREIQIYANYLKWRKVFCGPEKGLTDTRDARERLIVYLKR
jgi:hypothetical protein